MLIKIRGLYNFYCTDRKIYKYRLPLSLLVAILIGIFLLPNTAHLSDITPENIITLTNQERSKLGLEKLTANQFLSKAAYQKGEAILESQAFQHNIEGKKFSIWIREAGYFYSYVGENLAIDFITSQGIINAWKKSPTHKKNLLNPYFVETGVAVIEGMFDARNTILVVQIFGTPPRLSVNSKILGITNNNGPLLAQNKQIFYPPAQTWQVHPNQTTNPERLLTHVVHYKQTNQIYQSAHLNNHIVNTELVTLPTYSYNTFKENSYLNNGIFLNSINPFHAKTYSITQFFSLVFILIPLTLLVFLLYLYFYYFSIFHNLLTRWHPRKLGK